MKIPNVFILDKIPEKNLENLLQVKTKTMIRKVSDYKYECYCNICGDLAGSLEAVFGKFSKPNHSRIDCWPGFELEKRIRYKEPELIIKNFYGFVAVPKDEEFLESVIMDLEKKDLKSVFKKLDGNYLPFYNLDEDKCYCWTHWLAYQEEKLSSFR
ncbi:MAG: hypothetical protein Q8O03_08770 [Nanoarchaeota archaeon]|nr:hypothetical protein [Nanoarchaeota archaeon]